jgi:hypothetical protein
MLWRLEGRRRGVKRETGVFDIGRIKHTAGGWRWLVVYLFLVSALEHRGRGARFGIDLQTVRVASAGGTVFEKATRVAFQETFLFHQHGTESAVIWHNGSTIIP